MKEQLRCPSGEARIQNSTGNTVVACRIIIAQHLKGESNIEHWEIVPSNCLGDKFLECPVWVEECDKDWKNQLGAGKKYTNLQQKNKVIL